MSKGPVITGMIFLGMGAFVCHQALQLSLGRPSHPGPGFVAFGLGSILLFLSVLYLRQSIRQRSRGQIPSEGLPLRTLLAAALLCSFAATLHCLGYLVSTFFLFLVWLTLIERKKWYLSLPISFLAVIFIYYFNLLFSIQLPKGILKGF